MNLCLISTMPKAGMTIAIDTAMREDTEMMAPKIHEAGARVDFTVQFDCEAFGQKLKKGDTVSVELAKDWNHEGMGDGGPFGWGGYTEETLAALGTVDTHFNDRVTHEQE
jgi:hypothetical protein